MERIRQVVRWLLAVERLDARLPRPPTSAPGAGLGSLLFGLEPLPVGPAPPRASAKVAGLGAMLFEVEPLPCDAGRVVAKPARPFLSWLLAFERLESSAPPPQAPARGGPGLAAVLFQVEPLASDPEPPVKPVRPFFKWLVWPEAIPAQPASTTPKRGD